MSYYRKKRGDKNSKRRRCSLSIIAGTHPIRRVLLARAEEEEDSMDSMSHNAEVALVP